MTSRSSTATISILSLGDSYTIGEGVQASERWPNQLVDALRRSGFVVADPVIIARTGWTTDELSVAIDRSPPRGTFDLVTLLIGVNDQYRGRAAAEYAVEFRALLEKCVGFAGNVASRVIVISIPDWGLMPFASATGHNAERIAADIDEYNRINRTEASRVGAAYADVTTLSRVVGRDLRFMASDGLHPSGPMYEVWARNLIPVAERVIVSDDVG